MEPVLLEKENHVGWLTLNRPDKRNALSIDVMTRVFEKLKLIEGDPDIHVVVLKGNGPAFCAGHDLQEMSGPQYDLSHFSRIFELCTEMMTKLHQLPQPVIAQVHGIATAAGCQLVAACDLAIAEEGTRFATPGVKIGLFCTTPMIPLVRVIGRRRALEMLMTGRFVSAREAESFGLVNKVVPAEELEEATRSWAEELAQFSSYTTAYGKRAFYAQVDLDERSAYNYAQQAIAANCLADDAQEGIGAFLEKREPHWKGR